MKKIIGMLICVIAMAVAMTATTAFADGINGVTGNAVRLQINNPMMNACGVIREVDPGRGTKPVIENGSTLVPIRAILEQFGCGVTWDESTRSVSVSGYNKMVVVTIDSDSAVIWDDNGENHMPLTTAPKIINGRTMVPLRFVSESLGLSVDWEPNERVITITEPKSAPVTFSNQKGAFIPIGDAADIRMGAKDTVSYRHDGKDYTITTDIYSAESVENPTSSITINGKKYEITSPFNFMYAAVADLAPNADGFELFIADSGVSDDYAVTVFTYNQHGLVCTKTYSGMTYTYYKNGTGTVYCDKNGHIINEYIGFIDPPVAISLNTITGGDGILASDDEYTMLYPKIEGAMMKFGIDLFADYRAVDTYPDSYDDIWQMTESNTFTVKKGTPVVIDKIVYDTDENFNELYVRGYYARIDGKKYVIQLQYAG